MPAPTKMVAPTNTPVPTPLPISVSLNAYKQTDTNGLPTGKPLYLQARVYQRATGQGVAGLMVTVVVQWDDLLGHHTDTITLGPTDANGYADDCGSHSYALNEQLTVGTQPVANPPGGQPAPGLSSVTVQTAGTRSFCNSRLSVSSRSASTSVASFIHIRAASR